MPKNKKSMPTGRGLKGRKNHGPKRHMFNEYGSMFTYKFGKLGLLTKYTNFKSWQLACVARGCKSPSEELWHTFMCLSTNEEKDRWFKELRSNKSSILSKHA